MPPMPERSGLRPLLRLLGRRLPKTRGELQIVGLDGPVVIARDGWGIPHVEAGSDGDAWFALGFCHGQDRAFQLEILARAGRGTVAELVGPAALPVDRLSRTLGFRRLAAAQLPMLDPDVAAVLSSYVAGVNAAAAVTPRPHELVLLRAQCSAWSIEDVLAFLGLQSLALSGNWDLELARLRILSTDGADALRAVDPTYPEWLPVVAPVGGQMGPAIDRLGVDLDLLRDVIGGGGASNAWAVGPAMTSTGGAILANDPHLGPNVPAPWYLAHLRTPDWELAGASFVGGPAFPSAHNGVAAWGITAGCTDSSDLFLEELDAVSGTVRGPDGPEPLTVLREEIAVRGGAPVVEEVRITSRGPIVTPLLDDQPLALSLRATWLEPAPVRGLIDVQRASSFGSFRAAFDAWPGPSLNVVYADAAGHIGWQLTGALPVRRLGNGTLPAPAWEGGWEPGTLAFDAMPHLADPPEGFVVSANNAPRADVADAPFLGVDWLDGYRAARIVECVAARRDWDVEATAALQVDRHSAPWRELRDTVLAVNPSDTDGRLAVELLAEWNGEAAADSPAASVFELFLAELAVRHAQRSAPGSWPWAIGAGLGEALSGTGFGARTVSHVVARVRAGEEDTELAAALAGAVAQLRSAFGPEPRRWAWGTVRPLRLRHVLAAQRPMDRIFNLGPVPMGGDANTVAQAGVRPLAPMANPAAIANHRMVIDLADVERSRFVVAGGQSGNPVSPHYADLFELWRRGDGVPIPWAADRVAAASVHRLILRPGNDAGATASDAGAS